MKRKFTLLSIFILCGILSHAQVYTGDLALYSQVQVDAFNYTEVTGTLNINGSNITDLTPLASLTSLGGSLIIQYNPVLTSLSGLENLTSVGWSLRINNNAALTSLSGLENLTSVGVDGDLDIRDNVALTSLAGLENLTSVGGSLNIDGNAALTSLSGLENLTSLGWFLRIYNTAALTSLSGLENLTSVGEDIEIINNAALTSLAGLENITSIGWLTINRNAALTSLSGLENITTMGGWLIISYNAALTSFCALFELISGGGLAGAYEISNNAVNPTQQEIIDNGPCNAPPLAVCQNVTVPANENCEAMVTTAEINNGSSDPDGDEISLSISPEGPYGIGVTIVTLIVDDGKGESATCEATVIVEDITPPVIEVLSSNPVALWPPNSKYETISIDQCVASVSDNCFDMSVNDVVITKATSDEAEDTKGNKKGGKKKKDDIVISDDCRSVDLRRETKGNGNGRVYTIHLSLTDDAGNEDTATCLFTVKVGSPNQLAVADVPVYEAYSNCNANGFIAEVSSKVKTDTGQPNIKHETLLPEYKKVFNYPNPFKTSTTFTFGVPEKSDIILSIYNLQGQLIQILYSGSIAPGSHNVVWDGTDSNGTRVANGIYMYRLLNNNSIVASGKAVLRR